MSKQNHLIMGTTSDGAITLSPKTLQRHFGWCYIIWYRSKIY